MTDLSTEITKAAEDAEAKKKDKQISEKAWMFNSYYRE